MATNSTQDATAALADATSVDWLQHLIEAQADFTREVGNLYASSARGLSSSSPRERGDGMTDERHPNPAEETKRLYDEAETRTARAFEHVVSRDSFGELLARMTENAVAVTRIWTDIFDLVLRNLRVAGRQDIIRLARQLGRTDDKVEMLLQEVERLQDRLGVEGRARRTADGRHAASGNGARERSSGDRDTAATTGSGDSS